MEHKKISGVIFDMDGVIVDSEFVYMDYLLEFARKKNPEVTMDQLNPMVGLSRKDSWTVMKNAVDNGQTWEELRDEFAVLDIYIQVDYKKIFRPDDGHGIKKTRLQGGPGLLHRPEADRPDHGGDGDASRI